MLDFENILEVYLRDDGLERDLVSDLANPMGIDVYSVYQYPKGFEALYENSFAMTSIFKDSRKICVNCINVKDPEERRFLLAYQLAEVIKCNQEEFSSSFSLHSIDLEVYELAKRIYDRRSKKIGKSKCRGKNN